MSIAKKDRSRTHKRCFVCGDDYRLPNGNDWGKYGKGGWRTCGPVCQFYDRMRMV